MVVPIIMKVDRDWFSISTHGIFRNTDASFCVGLVFIPKSLTSSICIQLPLGNVRFGPVTKPLMRCRIA